jgi:predicted ATPase
MKLSLGVVRSVIRPHDGYFLRAEGYYNVATEIENQDKIPGPAPPIAPAYGVRALHEQSHGESFLDALPILLAYPGAASSKWTRVG